MILRPVFRNRVQPGSRVFGHSFDRPRFCGSQKSITRNVLSDFDVLDSEKVTEHSDQLTVFGPEKVWQQFFFLHDIFCGPHRRQGPQKYQKRVSKL
jgi:hypothetical protein